MRLKCIATRAQSCIFNEETEQFSEVAWSCHCVCQSTWHTCDAVADKDGSVPLQLLTESAPSEHRATAALASFYQSFSAIHVRLSLLQMAP